MRIHAAGQKETERRVARLADGHCRRTFGAGIRPKRPKVRAYRPDAERDRVS